ncbi:MAG: YihY/virulence factor BrkB family protein [Defluviitaleaceae bacterium]|nr:YihY/virulence factor BrkB family protein [Defluviitaleaceae bacterium]
MKRLGIFLFNLTIKCHADQVFERAAGLTLRVLLAFFPFLVFLMSLMGFLDVDESAILSGLYSVLPGDVSELVQRFVAELSATRSAGLLSAALFFSVYNTTNGFRAIIRCTNRAYDVREGRGLARQVGFSFLLMLLFSVSLIVMLGVLVFGGIASGAIALVILVLVTTFMYKLACAKRLPFKHVLPGGVLTVLAWAVVGATFGFITQNFTQYPAIYGSIAGVFILILWLNAVSIIFLMGNEINALLHEFLTKE